MSPTVVPQVSIANKHEMTTFGCYSYVVVLQSLCLTLCDPMDYSTTGSSVLHYLLEFSQIHVH